MPFVGPIRQLGLQSLQLALTFGWQLTSTEMSFIVSGAAAGSGGSAVFKEDNEESLCECVKVYVSYIINLKTS